MKLEILHNLGLSEKSAQVYVAALSLGTASMQDIAKKAGIKRPTAYLHVEDLITQGLIEKYPLGKKEYFRAMDPRVLEKRAESQMQATKDLMPILLGLQQTIAGRPRVSVVEGRRAMEQVYKEIEEAHSIRFWTDLAATEEYFFEPFRRIGEAVRKNEIFSRDIIPNTLEARKSSKHYAEIAGRTYSSRVAKSGSIVNDNVVYDDSVAMFRLHQHNFFVVLIKEPTIATTMKTLFDMAWESAEPFIGR